MAVEYKAETRRTGGPAPAPEATNGGAPRRGARWTAVLRTPLGATACVLLLLVLLMAAFGPLIWSGKADAVDTTALLQGSSSRHLMGTDNLGRDVLARVLVATRLSVGLALLATAIGVTTGLVLGAAPALLGRRAGRVITSVVNIAVAFPGLLLALFFAVVFGVGAKGAVLAIGFATAPGFARLTQTLVASVAERDFVAAARVAGVGRFRVLVRHILPNVAEPLVVNATIGAGGALLAFSGLSFLGLGVQAPSYDWGRLLGDGLSGIYTHPAAALAPGVAVVIAGLAFNLVGEAVAKAVGSPGVQGAAVEAAPAGPAPDAERAAARDGRAGRSGAPGKGVQGVAGDRAAAGGRGDGADGDGGPVLAVEGLRVSFSGPGGPVTPVRGVGFTVDRGEAVGVVGESGSGKSLTALAVSRLVEHPAAVHADRLDFLGAPLAGAAGTGGDRGGRGRSGRAARGAHRRLLGTSLAMVFQDPMTSFNPTMRVGPQLAEVAREHLGMSRRQALARAVRRLRDVRVPAAERRAAQYPHEFSGGMRQRAMIGMGVMGSPSLIIADEPTTALDVTVQQQVLRLLDSIRRSDGVALLLISHDITVVTQSCDRVLVMYAGRVVEELPTDRLRSRARHPYTRALLATVPGMDTDLDRPLAVIPGRPAAPDRLPPGCAFAPRCAYAQDRCRTDDPVLEVLREPGRPDEPAEPVWPPHQRVACWYPRTDDAAQEERAGRDQRTGGAGPVGRAEREADGHE